MTNRSDYGKNAEHLDLLWSSRTRDVQFYVEEAAKFQKRHRHDEQYGSVLELGFGTGRIGFQIAMQNRMAVYGIEKSVNMLKYAKSRLKDLPIYRPGYVWVSESDCMEPHSFVDLREGDMGNFSFGMHFPLIIIPFRGFQHLLTRFDQLECLWCCSNAMWPDGKLILDLFKPKPDMDERWPLNKTIIAAEIIDEKTGRRVVYKTTKIKSDKKKQVFKEMHRTELYAPDGTLIETVEVPITLRWTYREEMKYMFKQCGFEIEEIYGDFDRRPYEEGIEQIWIVRKTPQPGRY